MSGIHRLGDQAKNPADAHGCPACAHTVQGPLIGASPTVFANGMPVGRTGDPGIHACCCGPNTWNNDVHSPDVYANGIEVCRLDDATIHCGGQGSIIEASSDVIVNG